MSDERREQAWQAWWSGRGYEHGSSRAFNDGWYARNGEMEALKAALRTAREALLEYHSGCGVPDEPCFARETLAEIDAVLDAS